MTRWPLYLVLSALALLVLRWMRDPAVRRQVEVWDEPDDGWDLFT